MSSKSRKKNVVPASTGKPENQVTPRTPADWLFLQPEIIDQLHDSIIITDLQGQISGCNGAASRMFGYSQDELIGQNVGIFYPEEDREILQSAVLLTVMGKGQIKTEQRNRTKSGAVIYVQLTVTLLRDSEGTSTALVGISKDITERKLTEMALRQSDRTFQGLVQASKDFLMTAGRDGRTEWHSHNFYEYTGASGLNHEIARDSWAEYLHPEDRDRVTTAWIYAAKAGKPYESEHRIRRHDGVYHMFRVRIVPVLDAKRDVERWVGIATDIELQRKTEAALHQSEERFKAIFNQTFQFIGLLSTDGILLEANETAQKFGGVTRDDVVGLPLWETPWWRISKSTQKQLQDAVKRAAAGEFVHYEVEVWDANQEAVPIDFTLRPLINDAGQVVLLIPEGHDLREQKRTEAALRESENRFKTLAEAIPHSVWMTSPEGAATYFNERWLRLTGMTMEQGLGTGWLSAIHPEDAAVTTVRWQTAAALDRTFEAELRLKTADGAYRWQLARAVPYKNSKGICEQWFGTCTDIHDLRMAKDVLEERETTLRNFYDHSPVAMAITELHNDDVLVVYGNPAACKMYGVGTGGASGYTIKGMGAYREELERSVAQHRKCVISGKPVVSEYLRENEGERRWYQETLAPLDVSARGNPRFTLVTKDISGQKLAEEALRKNEEQFRLAVKTSPIVAFHQDKELRYTWIYNPSLGYKPEDFLGKRDTEVFERAEDGEVTEGLKRSVLASGEGVRAEVCIHHLGRPEYYDLTIEATRDGQGEITGVSCTSIDVSMRRHAEDALRQQQRVLETLIESSTDYIYMKDRDGRYVFINSAAAKAMGKPALEIVGKDDYAIFPSESASIIRGKELQLMATGVSEVFEESHQTAAGIQHMQTSKGICRDANGKIVGVVGISRDITEAKAVEQAAYSEGIASAAAHMGHVLAHEINNPLAALTNSLYLLQHGNGNLPANQLLQAAQDSLSRVSTITRKVLGLYRQKGNLTRIRLVDMVEDILSGMDARIRDKGVLFEKRLNFAEFRGTEPDIRQVMAALMENAVEQSRSMIKIRLYPMSGPQGGFRLIIADDGPGIPIGLRERVFEPFFSTKEQRGSGLGLWIARRIANKYSGSVRLRSSNVAGASYTCVILKMPSPG